MSSLEREHQQFVESLRQGANNIMVTVRLRPLNSREALKSEFETVKILDEHVLALLDPGYELNPDDVLRKNRNKEMQFAFDFVFGKETTQQEVYHKSAHMLVPGVFEGFNATVFAYGATGAGKTYTMIGNSEKTGIMEQSMNDLFKKLQEVSVTKDVIIRVSYIEIYNETIRDLLSQTDKNLELREDPQQGVIVNGLTEIEVKTTQEILHLLKIGNKNRTIESTGANEVSSRSHAVLQIVLQVKDKASGINTEVQFSKLSLVDLAGSERAANTNNRGIRLYEGAKINQSLLILGNCIQALSEATEKNIKNPFIQYRGSKLTRLLKDSLGGNCRTVMIANVSSYVNSFEDTYNTLNFANRAKNIKTTVQRNCLVIENHMSNYTQLIDQLRKENQNLKKLLLNKSPILEDRGVAAEMIESKIAEHFKEEIEIKRKLTDLEDKIDEAKSEQAVVLTKRTKDSSSNPDTTDDNSSSILTDDGIKKLQVFEKVKQEAEKKAKLLLKARANVQKMISSDSVSLPEQQYLNTKLEQNALLVENEDTKLRERRAKGIADDKQRQILVLRDQLKLRDDIILEQNNLLSRNQLATKNLPSESLIDLNDIEAFSFIQKPINGSAHQNGSTAMKPLSIQNQSPARLPEGKQGLRLPQIQSPFQNKLNRIAGDSTDSSSSNILEFSAQAGTKKISALRAEKKDKYQKKLFDKPPELNLSLQYMQQSIQSVPSSKIQNQQIDQQFPLSPVFQYQQMPPFPLSPKMLVSQEDESSPKSSKNDIYNSHSRNQRDNSQNNGASNQWKRPPHFEHSKSKRIMVNYYGNFKQSSMTGVHSASRHSPISAVSRSLVDKDITDQNITSKVSPIMKSVAAPLDSLVENKFQLPSRPISTSRGHSKISQINLNSNKNSNTTTKHNINNNLNNGFIQEQQQQQLPLPIPPQQAPSAYRQNPRLDWQKQQFQQQYLQQQQNQDKYSQDRNQKSFSSSGESFVSSSCTTKKLKALQQQSREEYNISRVDYNENRDEKQKMTKQEYNQLLFLEGQNEPQLDISRNSQNNTNFTKIKKTLDNILTNETKKNTSSMATRTEQSSRSPRSQQEKIKNLYLDRSEESRNSMPSQNEEDENQRRALRLKQLNLNIKHLKSSDNSMNKQLTNKQSPSQLSYQSKLYEKQQYKMNQQNQQQSFQQALLEQKQKFQVYQQKQPQQQAGQKQEIIRKRTNFTDHKAASKSKESIFPQLEEHSFLLDGNSNYNNPKKSVK